MDTPAPRRQTTLRPIHRASITAVVLLFAVAAGAAMGALGSRDELVGPVDAEEAAEAPTARPAWQSIVAHTSAARVATWAQPSAAAASGVVRARWLERGQLTFLVIDRRPGWVQVLLPRRPNGSTAWLRAGDVQLTTSEYSVHVDLERRRIVVRHRGRRILAAPVAVGSSATPTPRGRHYVTSRVRVTDASGPYGPHAIGLSAHSEVLDTFRDQPAQIALHGTNQPGLLGQAVSNGCIRMPNPVARQIAGRVPLGTPVIIT